MDYFSRSRALIGDEKFASLQNKKILVIGLGGVGGTAFEAFIRTGVKSIVGIDCDVVQDSNINRQILFTRYDIGKSKSSAAFARAKSINEEVDVETINIKINDQTISYLDKYDFDFAIDAIDDIDAKVLLTKYFISRNIPFVSSLGMGNRIDGTKVSITKLNRTHDDPLAKKFRYLLKNEGVDISKVDVIFSEALVYKSSFEGVNSVMMSPSSAGLCAVSYFIENYL